MSYPTAAEQAAERDALRKVLLSQLESLLVSLYPHGRVRLGKFQIGDIDGHKGRSLEVVLAGPKAGLWLDRATGDGGDVFDLVAAINHLDTRRDFVKVVAAANDWLGRTPISVVPRAPVVAVERVTTDRKTVNDDLGPVTARWNYLDVDGKVIARVTRFDPVGEKRVFLPWDVLARKPRPPEIRPLYNQPGLAKAACVILVEGEKCAEALIQLGLAGTTAMSGANAPVDKTDWSPLSGKIVLIWPDRDKPGWTYATAAGYAALAHGAEQVFILIPPDIEGGGEGKDGAGEDGWDVADAVAEGFDVLGFIESGARMELHRETSEPVAAERSVPGSDDWLALEFTLAYARDWQYVALWGKWLVWDGRCWRTELTLQATDLIRHVCRGAALAHNSERTAVKLGGSATVAGVERLARTDRHHAATAEAWDADPWLLNTPKGIVDLHTGHIRAHRREDRMTRVTEATPCSGFGSGSRPANVLNPCPTWLQFLEDVTQGDKDLIGYLQRIVGYCLTGVTSEHALFFLYGTGANGKSVFVNTIATLLGGYSTNAPMDTFMETRSDRHPTDMAGLRGARFVSSVETEQGRRWAESKIKSLTGGDKITARFMRQDFFDYIPQFKLVIAGNHKPMIRNVDEAMRRRLHLIPFTVTVPPERRDKQLAAKLLQERDGIMAWAVEGCLLWQRSGLRPPAAVLAATEEYFEGEDALGRWLEENCTQDKALSALTAHLFTNWKDWADAAGEFAGSVKRFADCLTTRGFEKWRNSLGQRGFKGLRLKYSGSNDDWRDSQ